MAKLSNQSVIYDFETLSQDPVKGIVVNFAALVFDETRFKTNPYTFKELVESAELIKFDTKEQVEVYGRRPDKGTLDWWSKQNPEARSMLNPSSEDVSISELYDFCKGIAQKPKRVYTRGNSFDPVFLSQIMLQLGQKEPWDWWNLRDTRSIIDGMVMGVDFDNKYMPEGVEGFIHHNPIHDIALDVIRIQALYVALI
jgi:hypothetical protein